MARTCSICRHEKRPAIDEALVAHVPLQKLVQDFDDVSVGALHRHKQHLGGVVMKKHETEELARTETLLDQVRRLITRCQALADESCEEKDRRSAILALREVSRNLELLAQMTGALEGTQVSVQFNQVNVHSGAGTDADSEIAMLIGQLTRNFAPEELERYRQLANVGQSLGRAPSVTRMNTAENAAHQIGSLER